MRFSKRNWLLALLGLVIGALIVIQFIPSGYSHSNPPVVAEPEWDSEATRMLAVRACFDCHSNETVWPWYSRIAPMSWIMEEDVRRGREALNFSEWTAEAAAELETEEAVELIAKNEMPLPYYNILHPEARLSANEKGQLITGLMATLEDEDLTSEDLDQSDGEGDVEPVE